MHPLQQKVKHHFQTFNFRFHTYGKKFKCVTSHVLDPSLCHILSHLLGSPSRMTAVTASQCGYNLSQQQSHMSDIILI